MTTANSTPKPKRRWFAFRLRTLLVLVGAVACLTLLTRWVLLQRWPDAVFFHDFYFTVGTPATQPTTTPAPATVP